MDYKVPDPKGGGGWGCTFLLLEPLAATLYPSQVVDYVLFGRDIMIINT